MRELDEQGLVEFLTARLEELRTFDETTHRESRWNRWHNEMQTLLRHTFGEDSHEVKSYRANASWGRMFIGPKDQNERDINERFQEIARSLTGWLEALIGQIERFGLPTREIVSVGGTQPNVFVAHGSGSAALTHLVDFLVALGCQPIIAEKMPSQGRSVNENVEFWMGKSHCAVVLATGDELMGDEIVARPNVHIEIGQFQERFKDKVVYLLEEGATLPSNVAEKVYERFTQDNMTKAFIKIANEFRALEILEAKTTNGSR